MVEPSSAPKRRTSRAWWWRAIQALVLAGVLLLAALAWMLNTERGSRVAISLAQNLSAGSLRVDGWQGCLCDHWQAARLELRLPGFALNGEALDVHWQPGALLRRQLRVEVLQAAALELRFASSGEPASLPQSLALPLGIEANDIRIARLLLGELRSTPQQPDPYFEASQLGGAFMADAQALRVERLSARLPGLSVSGSGHIGVAPPFDLGVQLQASTRVAERDAQLQLSASGPLAEPKAQLALRGDGLQGTAETTLQPFAGVPLRQLQVAVHGLDPSLFHPAAPRAQLDATVQLQPQGTVQGEGANPADWQLAGRIEIRNRKPEAFDRGGLPLQQLEADLAWAERRLRAERLRIRMGDGELAGHAGWRQLAGDTLGVIDSDLSLQGVLLDKLVAAARPLRLSGQLVANSSAQSQTFTARLRGDGVKAASKTAAPLLLDVQGEQRDGVLRLSRGELGWGGAHASVQGELGLQGRRNFRLTTRLAHFNPQALSPQIPAGDINLQGGLSGSLAPSWRAELRLDVAESRLAGRSLQGRVHATVDPSRLQAVDLDIDASGNRLQASGALGHAEDRLRFTLDAPKLERLLENGGGSLQAQGLLAGSLSQPWGSLEAKLAELRLPAGWRVDAAQLQAELQAGADGRFSAQGELGRVVSGERTWVSRGQLRVSGTRGAHRAELSAESPDPQQQLRLALTGGLQEGRWLGQLSELVGSGQFPFHLSEAATLEAGPQRVALGPARIATGNGQIDLQQTAWTPQEIVAQGRMRGLQVGLSVDEFQRTVMRGRSLSLGGEWDVRIGQSPNGLVRIYREDGDLVLQGDSPLALGLDNLDLNLAAQDGRLAVSANISGARIGVITAVLTAAAERVGAAGVRLVPDSPLVGVATVDVPSIAWLGPVLDQNLRVGGSLRGEFTLGGTPYAPVGQGRLQGKSLEVALADQGLRLSDGALLMTSNAGRLVLEQLEFVSRRSLAPPDSRLLPAAGTEPGRLSGSGQMELRSGEGELRLRAERVAVLQTPTQWLLVSGPATLSLKPGHLKLDAQLRADGGYFGVAKGGPPSLSEDVVVRGRVVPPAQRLRVDAKVRFDMGDAFFLKAYGIDTRLAGQLDLTQEEGRWRLRGAIDTDGGLYAAYGQRLSIERGTVSFSGPLDDPALNVLALRKGLAVEAGVEVSGTARAPRVRLVSEPNVPETEKLSWLLLGRASEAGGQDAGLLLTAASAALGDDGEGVMDKLLGGVGLDEVTVGQSTDVMRQRTSRVASSATGTPSSAGGATTSQDQVLTVGKRLSARAYLALEQNLSGTESVVKLSVSLNRMLSLIARAGTDNALDLQYTITFR